MWGSRTIEDTRHWSAWRVHNCKSGSSPPLLWSLIWIDIRIVELAKYRKSFLSIKTYQSLHINPCLATYFHKHPLGYNVRHFGKQTCWFHWWTRNPDQHIQTWTTRIVTKYDLYIDLKTCQNSSSNWYASASAGDFVESIRIVTPWLGLPWQYEMQLALAGLVVIEPETSHDAVNVLMGYLFLTQYPSSQVTVTFPLASDVAVWPSLLVKSSTQFTTRKRTLQYMQNCSHLYQLTAVVIGAKVGWWYVAVSVTSELSPDHLSLIKLGNQNQIRIVASDAVKASSLSFDR